MVSRSFEKTTQDDFRRAFETNAIGVLHGIQAVLDPMRANGGGSVVILSSVAGLVGIEGLAAYCASKAANTMIARCAAIELGQYNIRVNSIHPGKVDNPMSGSAAVAPIGSANASEPPPLGRIPGSADIPALIALLPTGDPAYIIGAPYVSDSRP